MSRPTNLIVTLVAITIVAATSSVEAGGCKNRVWKPAPVIIHPPVVQPPIVNPIQQNSYYFGMSVELASLSNGYQGLRIANITPNSPAWRAGLEVGDVILSSNGQMFQYARDNQEGVRMLQNSVGFGGGALPTNTGVSTRVVGFVAPQGPTASLTVLDSRTGQNTLVQVQPQQLGGIGGPAPTALAH